MLLGKKETVIKIEKDCLWGKEDYRELERGMGKFIGRGMD